MRAERWSGRREVDTRALFREAKRRVRRASGDVHARGAEFFCECGDSRCTERIRLTLREYEAMRAMPGRFLVALSHEGAPYRRVIESNDRFCVVVDATGSWQLEVN
jgi:hypothetical protein